MALILSEVLRFLVLNSSINFALKLMDLIVLKTFENVLFLKNMGILVPSLSLNFPCRIIHDRMAIVAM